MSKKQKAKLTLIDELETIACGVTVDPKIRDAIWAALDRYYNR